MTLYPGEKHIQEDMTKVCTILSTVEQMKWVMILIISHNIRAKGFPVNLSRAILKASRRKSFFMWHKVYHGIHWQPVVRVTHRKKRLENDCLSEQQIGGTSVWSSTCNPHLQNPKTTDFCELRSIANSRSLCSHPFLSPFSSASATGRD